MMLAAASAWCASSLLQLLGVPVALVGQAIVGPSACGGFGLMVAPECGGLRSICVLAVCSAVYASSSFRRAVTLAAVAVPAAFVCNVLRILALVLVARAYGQECASGLVHDMAGYAFFLLGVLAVLGVDRLLTKGLT